MARVRADQAALADDRHWRGLPPGQLADQVIRQIAAIFFRHAAFLRPVMLLSAVHPEVKRRGAYYSQELGNLATDLLMRTRDHIDHPDPETAVRAAFNAAFATLVMRVAYGPAFATPAADDETFLQTLSAIVRRYLFRP